MTSSQLNVSETPPVSTEDLQTLAKNETDENGLILGKFKSVEDLAASYKELEGKLGTVTEEDQATEETQEESTDEFNPEEYYGDGLASVLEEVGIDAQDITKRFTDTGEISEDDYSKLGEAGFSKQVVDTYLDGLKGVAEGDEIPEQQIQNIKDSVGGDESYEQMANWCQENLSEQEVKAFDKITETADAPVIQLAVEGLYSRYQNAMGVEPDLVTGRPAASGPRPFQSSAEVQAAVNDPRYGKDVAYTQSVYARYEGSDVFKAGNG
tara:strand:- start:292 stop:1092 length:801 start_codon:yes stop_codon:yes gene_type:complete